MYAWWSDVVHEGQTGDHTPVVRIGLRYGFILFIMSEVMFFCGLVLDLLQARAVSDGAEVAGDRWRLAARRDRDLRPLAPAADQHADPAVFGCAATWAHHALVHENNRKDLVNGLILAIILGALFTFFQAYEYSHAAFGFAGNIYGASFFMATGFHGFHVIIGTIFLTVCLIRAIKGHFTPEQHVGFEAAAWYWHFVDVVWLFLFAAIYVWGG